MQFNLKLRSSEKSESGVDLIIKIGNFWQKIYKYVFFACLIGAILLGLYTWRQSLSYGAWSSEKKLEYLNSQNRSVVLGEKNLEKALVDIELRKAEKVDGQNELRDIFRAY